MKKHGYMVKITFAAIIAAVSSALIAFPAYADGMEDAYLNEEEELSYVEISGISAPKAGCALDTSATVSVLSYKWEIPVIWLDNRGKPAEKAEYGKRYQPFLAFYIPEKYDCPEIRLAMSNAIFFPAVLKNPAVVREKYDFMDSSAEIYYIAGDPIPVVSDETELYYSEPEPRPEPKPEPEPEPKPEPSPEDKKKAEIRKYCRENTEKLIEKYGDDTLLTLIAQVKYVIEPQAVNLLKEKIPAFKKAAGDNLLGSHIGLYIDDSREDLTASVSYIPMKSGSTYYRLLVNPDSIYTLDTNTNKYVFDEKKESSFENAMTHEFVHAMMVDYSRTGMEGINGDDLSAHKELNFPEWFIEGTASTCDNCFNYRRNEYLYLGLTGESTVDYTNKDVLIKNYADHPEIYAISDAGTYSMGYLACMYLYSMADAYYTSDDTGLHPSGQRYTEPTHIIDSESMREGFSNILEALRGGNSLDSIIKTMSPVTESGDAVYTSTSDFAAKFMTNNDGGMSADFSAHFLYYITQTTADKNAAGNMLVGINRPDTPFMVGEITKSDHYVIPDDYDASDVYVYSDCYVRSSVDAKKAFASGGCSDLVSENGNAVSEQQLEAAKTAVTGQVSDEALEEQVSEEEPEEQVSEEMPEEQGSGEEPEEQGSGEEPEEQDIEEEPEEQDSEEEPEELDDEEEPEEQDDEEEPEEQDDEEEPEEQDLA